MKKHIPGGVLLTVITFFFGLLQLFILILYASLSLSFEMPWGEIIKACSILFFTSGVLAASAQTYFLFCKKRVGKLTEYVLFVTFPVLVIIISVASYIIVSIEPVDPLALAVVQGVILLVTFVYLVGYTAYERSIS